MMDESLFLYNKEAFILAAATTIAGTQSFGDGAYALGNITRTATIAQTLRLRN